MSTMAPKQIFSITEVFNSISGEISPFKQGCLTTFVRFFGCNLKCPYCDTPENKQKKYEIDPQEFLSLIESFCVFTGKICITGGEPLLQRNAVHLILDNFKDVWIETNGTYDFSDIIGRCGIVADIKLDIPLKRLLIKGFYDLKETDFIKFVIYDLDSFREAVHRQKILQLAGCKATFAYSACDGKLTPKALFDKLLKEKLPNTIMNIQMHKLLGFK